jgi:hypothetical protein
MSLQPGTQTLGPGHGSIEVRTYREGIAQKVGHDLIIDVERWEAVVDVGESGVPSSIQLQVEPRSLRVREGLHGVKPLTDKDRTEIRKTIDEKILGGQPIAFRSQAVEPRDGRLHVRGELTIAGTTRPAAFELELASDGRIGGTLEIVQSQWGIKPYRGFMGALKVRDAVELRLDVGPSAG